jgi:hypothetical protein
MSCDDGPREYSRNIEKKIVDFGKLEIEIHFLKMVKNV